MATIFNNLIGMMLDLSDAQLQKVKTYILARLNIVPTQAMVPVISSCPHYHGNHVIKFGKKNGKQRYFCNDCRKVFMATTNTLAEYSKLKRICIISCKPSKPFSETTCKID